VVLAADRRWAPVGGHIPLGRIRSIAETTSLVSSRVLQQTMRPSGPGQGTLAASSHILAINACSQLSVLLSECRDLTTHRGKLLRRTSQRHTELRRTRR
jgi:hypothetical protein